MEMDGGVMMVKVGAWILKHQWFIIEGKEKRED